MCENVNKTIIRMEKFKNNNFKDKKSPHQNQRRPNNHENSQNEKNNQHKNASNKNKTIINDNDKKKVHYVLNPRALRKKIKDIKEMDQRVKEKEHQTKKRKRNAIYLKTTSRGQPKMNGRMKLLYEQVARSCGEKI